MTYSQHRYCSLATLRPGLFRLAAVTLAAENIPAPVAVFVGSDAKQPALLVVQRLECGSIVGGGIPKPPPVDRPPPEPQCPLDGRRANAIVRLLACPTDKHRRDDSISCFKRLHVISPYSQPMTNSGRRPWNRRIRDCAFLRDPIRAHRRNRPLKRVNSNERRFRLAALLGMFPPFFVRLDRPSTGIQCVIAASHGGFLSHTQPLAPIQQCMFSRVIGCGIEQCADDSGYGQAASAGRALLALVFTRGGGIGPDHLLRGLSRRCKRFGLCRASVGAPFGANVQRLGKLRLEHVQASRNRGEYRAQWGPGKLASLR